MNLKDYLYYQDDWTTIYCGDCLEILPLFGNENVDLVITDPPYNKHIGNWDVHGGFENLLKKIENVLLELSRILRTQGQLYLWGNSDCIAEFKKIAETKGFKKISWCVWNKKDKQHNATRSFPDVVEHCLHLVNSGKRFGIQTPYFSTFGNFVLAIRKDSGLSRAEMDNKLRTNTMYAWIEGRNYLGEKVYQFPTKEMFYKIREILNPWGYKYDEWKKEYDEWVYIFNESEIRIPKKSWSKNRPSETMVPYNIFEYSPPIEIHHETPKPLEIIQTFIKASSNKNDLIFDCFLGSGTTCIAAKNLNRQSIGIEINPDYCEIAVKRLKQEVFDFTK